MKCQFCNNEFSNKQNLNYHQKKAKYCLKIQGKLSTASTFKCTICHKEFMSGVTLRRHQKNVNEFVIASETVRKPNWQSIELCRSIFI